MIDRIYRIDRIDSSLFFSMSVSLSIFRRSHDGICPVSQTLSDSLSLSLAHKLSQTLSMSVSLSIFRRSHDEIWPVS